MTDKEFGEALRRIADGDREAFRRVYDEYFGTVYSAALAVTANKASAEDVTSEFFVKLWSDKAADYSAERGGHKRWLAVCAKNLAVNYIKKFGKEELVSYDDGENDVPDAAGSGTEEQMTSKAVVSSALSRLSENEREIIHLKYFCGYTLKEISKILGIPIGTAAWRCRNSENKLKKIIGEVR